MTTRFLREAVNVSEVTGDVFRCAVYGTQTNGLLCGTWSVFEVEEAAGRHQ